MMGKRIRRGLWGLGFVLGVGFLVWRVSSQDQSLLKRATRIADTQAWQASYPDLPETTTYFWLSDHTLPYLSYVPSKQSDCGVLGLVTWMGATSIL